MEAGSCWLFIMRARAAGLLHTILQYGRLLHDVMYYTTAPSLTNQDALTYNKVCVEDGSYYRSGGGSAGLPTSTLACLQLLVYMYISCRSSTACLQLLNSSLHVYIYPVARARHVYSY
jgi:hypothetical protein